MNLFERLNFEIYGNSLGDWFVAMGLSGAIALACLLGQRLLARRLSEHVARSATRLDDAFLEMLGATRPWLVGLAALSLGAQSLNLSATGSRVLAGATTLALFLQVGLWGRSLIGFWARVSRARVQPGTGAGTHLSAAAFVAQLLLWTVIVLLVLDNLGINITTLVAGLGIGGVAVALAVQNILGDLFASMSILVDKPFVIGDFIIVDSFMGTVEHVGLKTTRLRSLDGELIVFSNGDLLKSRLRNYQALYERRVVFAFSMPMETSPDDLARVPAMVRRIIESQKKVRFERAHFQKYGERAFDFESVYWVMDPDYNLYMDIQQAINLEVLRQLERDGLGLANRRDVVVQEAPLTASTPRPDRAVVPRPC